MPRPILIDCDPGTDDAVALMAAFASEDLDVVAVTSVAGNVGIEYTTKNALNIAELAGSKAPVGKGASVPMFREQVQASHVHGLDGLHGIQIAQSDKQVTSDAISLIYEMVNKYENDLEILAIGPLTNLAQTFKIYPEITQKIKRIVLMGGGHRIGNVTPVAEFNIFADAEAAQIIFQSGIEIHMIGLDVTTARGLNYDEASALLNGTNDQIDFLNQLLLDRVSAEGNQYPQEAYIHDVIALLYMIDPTILSGDWYHVDVETKSSISYGKTVVDYYHVTQSSKNCWVALELNFAKYLKVLTTTLKHYEN